MRLFRHLHNFFDKEDEFLMKKRLLLGLGSIAALLVAFFCTTGLAFAHEVRHVGPYTFVVGFLNEPAYANYQNSLDLTVCKGDACNYTVRDGTRVVANPVENLDKTLKAEVSFGGNAPLALKLAARYGNPGKYAGYFLPSKAGAYTFHIFGTIEGNAIDEKFTSGPNTFGETTILPAYPQTANTQATSNTTTLQSQVQQAQDNANRALGFGIGGGVVGLVGLIVAGMALGRKRTVAPATSSAGALPTPVEDLRG